MTESKIVETDLAYIAGILDGEGYIIMQVANYGLSYQIKIGIVNSNLELLEWIQELLGGYIYEKSKQKSSLGKKPCFELRWHKLAKIQEVLSLLLPYLRVKETHARLGLDFLGVYSKNRILGSKGPKNFSSADFGVFEDIYDSFVGLNNPRTT